MIVMGGIVGDTEMLRAGLDRVSSALDEFART